MCLIGFAWRQHPRFPLVLAANRDEFHARETAAAHFWPSHPDVLGGRDLRAGGTWLGVTRNGRFAALSNYREAASGARALRSRGELVREFLLGDEAPPVYAARRAAEGRYYGGFNLLAGDLNAGTLHYLSNRGSGPKPVPPGIHGVSNALLDTPWPKVRRLKAALATDQGDPGALCALLFDALLDTRPAADAELPHTGIGRDRERFLSPPFITGEEYGTRACTVLLVDDAGGVTFVEKRFGRNGRPAGESRFEFALRQVPVNYGKLA